MYEEYDEYGQGYETGSDDGYEKALTELIEALEEQVEELAESDGIAAQGLVDAIDTAREMLNKHT